MIKAYLRYVREGVLGQVYGNTNIQYDTDSNPPPKQ